ncbi:GntR family transcriptional regulator [Ketogulonicigenium robustum]|uniref:GntR family transcriptional regulator n=1 Tax=Ketogulonicigenium robustum TaxID=92947 RepID=A0A1W6P148_9RHOB|nr:GntR family transcriptional regulator [Ketogulonicigenium robustum]ARO15164.1 GntR family transcriptional regulator [Ketogulonicigenium robustum]
MDIVEHLREAILLGTHPPGTVLSQSDLARDYGVSRIPVRDALQALAAEKLVEVVPGKGARVIHLDPAALREVYDLRLLLECDLLQRAIAAADAVARLDVEYALRRTALTAGKTGWPAGDWDFHAALYAPAARPRQCALVRDLRRICTIHASGYDTLASDTPRWLADHDALALAFAQGDAQTAVAVLQQHIGAAADALLGA